MKSFVDSYGKPGIFEDEFGKFVWVPRGHGFDIVRVVIVSSTYERQAEQSTLNVGALFKNLREEQEIPVVFNNPTMGPTTRVYPEKEQSHTVGTTRFGKDKAIIRAMNEARQKPKRITTDELVPPDVRKFYDSFWQGENRALAQAEMNRTDQEKIQARKWWWQRVWEALWVTR